MVRDAGAALSARKAGLHDRIERLRPVAPDRVHLKIAAVLAHVRQLFPECRDATRLREDLLHGRAAQEVLPERAQRGHLVALPRLL